MEIVQQEAQSDEERAAAELESIRLLGTFSSSASSGIIALVEGEKQRILIGERAAGWEVESVGPVSAVLRNGVRAETLELMRQNQDQTPDADPDSGSAEDSSGQLSAAQVALGAEPEPPEPEAREQEPKRAPQRKPKKPAEAAVKGSAPSGLGFGGAQGGLPPGYFSGEASREGQ